MNELITVIIPVYNVEKYLDKCLDSVVNQSYKNLEIIIVNDGSTDSSLEVCKKYESVDERIKIISKQNEGQSFARKTGFCSANGKYIVFVDSDDWLDSDYCEYLYNIAENAKADIATCTYYINDDISKETFSALELEEKDILRSYYNFPYIKCCVWNKIYKRMILQEDFFDNDVRTTEDVIFTCKALLAAKKIVCTAESKYHYNVANLNSTMRAHLTAKKIDDLYLGHCKQIDLVETAYPEDKILQIKTVEKLCDALIVAYNSAIFEKDKNNLKQLNNYINETYQKYKNLDILKNTKNKIKMILKYPNVYNFLFKFRHR
ncbi:MAG: glycosyltransferase [Treponema sp.]|nr:glycosyltransferase [Treponema sp.]